MFYPGEPAPLGPTDRDLLVLYSFSGRRVCEYRDFMHLIDDVKKADDICRWRLLFYPVTNLNFIPSACIFEPPDANHAVHHHQQRLLHPQHLLQHQPALQQVQEGEDTNEAGGGSADAAEEEEEDIW